MYKKFFKLLFIVLIITINDCNAQPKEDFGIPAVLLSLGLTDKINTKDDLLKLTIRSIIFNSMLSAGIGTLKNLQKMSKEKPEKFESFLKQQYEMISPLVNSIIPNAPKTLKEPKQRPRITENEENDFY